MITQLEYLAAALFDFVGAVYTDSDLYRDGDSVSPAVFEKTQYREYRKLNITESLKGVCWFYQDGTLIESGVATKPTEIYIIRIWRTCIYK